MIEVKTREVIFFPYRNMKYMCSFCFYNGPNEKLSINYKSVLFCRDAL